MRMESRTLRAVLMIAVLGAVVPVARAGGIDAVRGRKYTITKRHGPWMIMVATVHAPPKDRRGEGLTPEQAADELVFELRKKGIPAYPFHLEDRRQAAQAFDRSGRQRTSATRYYGGIAVLAGNYPSPQDKLARETLAYIKKFRPKFLTDIEGRNEVGDHTVLFRLRNGGIFRSTPGRPFPFSGAHLTPNPLLSAEEVRARRRDPLILKLNSGNEFSLLNNKGKYTLVVKTFYGKSVTAVDGQSFERKAHVFQVSDSLDQAARNAWELAVALRKYWKLESWVYHTHHHSLVTVGSFESENDPLLQGLNAPLGWQQQNQIGLSPLVRRFKAEYTRHARTGQRVLIGKGLTIPLKLQPGQKPLRQWVFDPQPRLMLVPKFGE